jgi:putative ABC transport system permease protein
MVGALLAGLLGVLLLVYTLAVSVRMRTGELAVLRALGMTSRRVGRVLGWEGLALAAAMLVVGIPIGVVLGAFSWRTVAHQLGVAEHLTLPPSLLLLIPGAIAIALLAAIVPAHRARHRNVAALLRVE